MGLASYTISTASNQIQHLYIGMQFGAGFEYQVWKAGSRQIEMGQ
jgi:hypothetical protein